MRARSSQALAYGHHWGLGNRLYDLAGQRPAVDWRFAQDRSLVDRIRGLPLTFTRTSGRTLENISGGLDTLASNLPAFSYRNGVSMGLDIWGDRTNSFSFCVNLNALNVGTQHTWGSGSGLRFNGTTGAYPVLVPNNGYDPTGPTADGIRSVDPLASSTTCTWSIYAIPAGFNQVLIRSNVTGLLATFTLTGAGVAPSPGAEITNATIERMPTGWYRLTWTNTTTASLPGNRVDYWSIRCAAIGNGSSGIGFDGYQAEVGGFAGPVILTNGGPLTRTADVCGTTDSAIVALINSGCLMYAEGVLRDSFPGVHRPLAYAGSADSLDRAELRARTAGTANARAYVNVNNVSQFDSAFTGAAPGTVQRIAMIYRANGFASAANSQSGTITGSTGTLGSAVSLQIGNSVDFANFLGGTISRFMIWAPGPSYQRIERIVAA